MDVTDDFRLVDANTVTVGRPAIWEPIVIPAATIAREIERLADAPQPQGGRRSTMLVHHRSTAPGLGLAPGVDVCINVLKPGEESEPVRRNSSQVEMCIGGIGTVTSAGRHFQAEKWDVWNIPSMQIHRYRNDGPDLFVRLSYSNAPLLEKMDAHFVEYNPQPPSPEMLAIAARIAQSQQKMKYGRETAPNIMLQEDGAWLRGYEFLVDIEVVQNKALHWPWKLVAPHLALTQGPGKRPIMLLYNPATERRNGTTHSFFATLAAVPPNLPTKAVGRGHRHSSVAINYYFQGHGFSVVDGQQVPWNTGDLMLSAPAFSEHAHYHGVDGSAALTVQDHPFQIGIESLIWQEDMGGPIITLGAEAGVTGYLGPREKGS